MVQRLCLRRDLGIVDGRSSGLRSTLPTIQLLLPLFFTSYLFLVLLKRSTGCHERSFAR